MKLAKLVLVGALSTSALFGHGLWVNAIEADSKKGKRVMVSFGFGYKAPIDYALPHDLGMKAFDLMTPDGEKIKLQALKKKPETAYESDALTIKEANLALQNINLTEKAEKGTYGIAYERPSRTLTTYINKKDKESKSNKPVDKIRDLKEVVSQTVSTNFGKAYFTNKEFSKAKAIGHKIEILPGNDYTKLNVGDTIELEVLFDGKPLKSGYVTAKNAKNSGENSFFGKIRDGKVKFFLNNNGQWIFEVNHDEKDKNITNSYSTSASLNIK